MHKFKQVVIPMIWNLINSKESESKAATLNILGSMCGLSIDQGINQIGQTGFEPCLKFKDFLPLYRFDP